MTGLPGENITSSLACSHFDKGTLLRGPSLSSTVMKTAGSSKSCSDVKQEYGFDNGFSETETESAL